MAPALPLVDALRLRRPLDLAAQLELQAHDLCRRVDPGQRTRVGHHLWPGRRVQAWRRLPEGAVRE